MINLFYSLKLTVRAFNSKFLHTKWLDNILKKKTSQANIKKSSSCEAIDDYILSLLKLRAAGVFNQSQPGSQPNFRFFH